MYRTSHKLIAAVAIVAAGVLPQRVAAQLPTIGTPEATADAVRLEARATQANGLGAAARLRERAAELRAPGDPLGVSDLVIAASARFYSGEPTRARELYVRAAERALADGDITVAANSFLLAALVANEQRDPVTLVLKARAERLTASPLLTEAQRRHILAVFEQPVRVAAKQQ